LQKLQSVAKTVAIQVQNLRWYYGCHITRRCQIGRRVAFSRIAHIYRWCIRVTQNARAPDWVVAALDAIAQEDTLKTLLSQYPPFERFLYGSAGDDTRQLYNPDLRQPPEYKIRQVLKQHGLWER